MATGKFWGKAVIFLVYKDTSQISNTSNKIIKVQKL